ncbi:MAG TPA: TerC family protein [Phycisphaerales bacterium]|nr:TerC family protein [Phycisphaerales bacterium]
MAELFTFENLAALVTLTAMEIVLGIDNIVFIAITASRLPPEQQAKARRVGLMLAMVMRIALLLSITWVMSLTKPLFSIPWFPHTETHEDGRTETLTRLAISGKDLVLIAGGLFLIYKATKEIHHKLEDPGAGTVGTAVKHATFKAVVSQIMVIDIVFSLDSVITAVGMAQSIWVMVLAVIAAVGVMMVFAGKISVFVDRHPTVKMLALSFLLLIGVMLVADGVHQHIPRGYIYFAMAFSLGVEMLNLRVKTKKAG